MFDEDTIRPLIDWYVRPVPEYWKLRETRVSCDAILYGEIQVYKHGHRDILQTLAPIYNKKSCFLEKLRINRDIMVEEIVRKLNKIDNIELLGEGDEKRERPYRQV